MKRMLVSVVAVVLALGACNKPSEENCRKAIANMKALLGTDSGISSTTDTAGDVRRCVGGSTKKAVECAMAAKTLDELYACDFISKKSGTTTPATPTPGSATPGSAAPPPGDTPAGSAAPGSAAAPAAPTGDTPAGSAAPGSAAPAGDTPAGSAAPTGDPPPAAPGSAAPPAGSTPPAGSGS